MSKLGLDTGENRCVIKFTNQSSVSPSHPSNAWDTGTFEKPVWWCTKDSDGYFSMPEQVYLIFLHQKTAGYMIFSSSITIYNSYLSGHVEYPLGSPYYYASGNPTGIGLRGSSMLWIEQISKFKPSFTAGSAGSTYDFWIIVIPL